VNQGASNGLTQADLAAFERLGIRPSLLDAARVCRVTDGAARAEYGIQFSVAADLSGIIFPYLDPASGERRTARLRRDHPELDATGKLQRKYLCPFGDARHLYFPPGAGAMLANADCPVAIVEAEKSALAVAALAGRSGRAMLAIATGGCWGWRGQTGIEPDASGQRVPVKGALADFDRIEWRGRDAIICFDSNAASNPRVQAARRALAEELGARGARVRIAEIPPLDGVNGPDDLIAHAGDAALLAILDAARPAANLAASDAEAAVAALERDQNAAELNACIKLIAAAPDPAQAENLAGRAAKALGINKETILGTLRAERKTIENVQRLAAENARREQLLRMAVIPAELISDLERFFSERAYLPPHVATALALWAINTWVFDVFDTTPYLLLDSPVPQCGKTTVLRLLEAVAREPRQATAATEAALFRLVEANQPTLFVDEAEMLAGKGERAEAVRTIANAGYKRGASVPRCTGEAANITVKDFPVYCPKAFAAIGGLRGALLDRCVVIVMARRPEGTRLKPVKEKSLRRDAEPIRERMEAYALQAHEALAAAYESEPDGGYWPALADREAELWEPLLHHARLAGIETETRALAAAESLSARKQQIQSEDQRFALAAELLDALSGWERATFAPGDLVPALENTDAWGARLAEKHEGKSKAACVGQFIRTLRLPSRQRTRAGTQNSAAEAIEKLRTLSPGKTATSATAATGPGKPMIFDVADAQGEPPFRSNSSAEHFGNAVAGTSAAVAPEIHDSATSESRINGGAVAGVADVADNSGPGGGYWGEV
jgi:hypothetical protein